MFSIGSAAAAYGDADSRVAGGRSVPAVAEHLVPAADPDDRSREGRERLLESGVFQRPEVVDGVLCSGQDERVQVGVVRRSIASPIASSVENVSTITTRPGVNKRQVSVGRPAVVPGRPDGRKTHNSPVEGPGMDQPEPADDWPGRPLSEAEAEDHLGSGVIGVWVLDHDDEVRSVTVPDGSPDDAVIDVVLETVDAFEMYSYTGGRWMDYGTQHKDDDEAPSMAGTLASYRLLAGESTLDIG